jgi:exopolyphosphatase/guanosine-5'-triphosphate,3'-diphosphate pyrophosphatase
MSKVLEAEGQTFAAIDLGSNSFHMIVARAASDGFQVIDRLKETVRMGAGLTADGGLLQDVRDRALKTLAQFGQRLRGIKRDHIRAVATNTVRQLAAPRAFLMVAETALGVPVNIISGREEARLIYLGVSHALGDARSKRLVIDIGGGSTECIIGLGSEALETESVQMGCVASTRRFFSDGMLSRKRWREAQEVLALEVAPFRAAYLARGWRKVIGSSGTIKSAAKLAAQFSGSETELNAAGLEALIERVIAAKEIDRINLPGLSNDRKPVIAGGLAVLETCFREFRISSMQVSEAALREGVLLDIIGRLHHDEGRLRSIQALAARAGIDSAFATRVSDTALALFEQSAVRLNLDEEDRDFLHFAALIHEVGLAISHSQHHLHGGYILENSDLPGFSKSDQQLLAVMVRCHRRALDRAHFTGLTGRDALRAKWLTALLRIAVTLHRTRSKERLPALKLAVDGNELKLKFPANWLQSHPLTRADLKIERDRLDEIGVRLKIVSGSG